MFSFKHYLEETKKTGCTCWTGYKRVSGTKPCSPGSCVKEESINESHYEDSEKHLNKANQALETNDMRSHHMHMANYHDSLSQWHDSKGRSAAAMKHENEAEKHEQMANNIKEEIELDEKAIDAKGYKSSTGGLTQKGVDAYNRKTGGHLQTAVTTPPSKLKAGSKAANRRKSFCARMSGVEGSMVKPNGKPTRKALALRKWNC